MRRWRASPASSQVEKVALFFLNDRTIMAARTPNGSVRKIGPRDADPVSVRSLARTWIRAQKASDHDSAGTEQDTGKYTLAGVFDSPEIAALAVPILTTFGQSSFHHGIVERRAPRSVNPETRTAERRRNTLRFVESTQATRPFSGLENLVTKSAVEVLEGVVFGAYQVRNVVAEDRARLAQKTVPTTQDWENVYHTADSYNYRMMSFVVEAFRLSQGLLGSLLWQVWRSEHFPVLLAFAYLRQALWATPSWSQGAANPTLDELILAVPQAVEAVMLWNELEAKGYPALWASKTVRNRTGLDLHGSIVSSLAEIRERPRTFDTLDDAFESGRLWDSRWIDTTLLADLSRHLTSGASLNRPQTAMRKNLRRKGNHR